MKIEYHPRTIADFNNASEHYLSISPILQQQFSAEVLSAIDRILANPVQYAEVEGMRRALLKRFPFSIVYRIIDEQTVRILVIRHHKRHPELGGDRA